jgi:NAD+ synthase (glutamine-hydrolysing)
MSTGFLRITACSHPISVADPAANARAAIRMLSGLVDSDIVLFSELSLTGYTCGDLFHQDVLMEATSQALTELATYTAQRSQLVVVGLPLRVDGRLYNAAAALAGGQVVAVVPKQFLPNYQEFYESRWFSPADGSEPSTVRVAGVDVPFGIDLLIDRNDCTIGIEICEDLWMPVPPSSLQAMAGASILLNLSGSNELIGKAAWRETLVRSQSGRCFAAYAYASAGPTESSTDMVFGGHCLIAENGSVLASSSRIGLPGVGWLEEAAATADVDLQHLAHDRQKTVSWHQAVRRSALEYRRISLDQQSKCLGERRTIAAHPFVPNDDNELHERCAEIFGIQCAALAKRVKQLPGMLPLNIGVSGGLDSTLALLVAVKTCVQQDWPATRIAGVTMPGFGTTKRTLNAARTLMACLGVTSDEIDIRQLCLDTFLGLRHKPFGIDPGEMPLDEFTAALSQLPVEHRQDLVFENVQARVRTMLLMSRGFVLGTGDMSEQALGWSTYNGDHMSMYNVNTSIPKTLVRFLVKYIAEHEFSGETREVLLNIVDTPISPELLPLAAGSDDILQLTEGTLGPYELHDFFLYHMIRFGASPQRILQLARRASFAKPYAEAEIRETLKLFLQRFFANQFKRSCVPDGPKVGSVSLSPRGDWRMPSDGTAAAWLAELSR